MLAERLKVKESEVVEMNQRMDNWEVSLESPVRSDSEDEQKSFLPHEGPGVEELVSSQEIRDRFIEIIMDLKGQLNDKEKLILEKRLLTDDPQTLQTIADQFSISRERVRQIEANLLKKLKKHFEKELPDVKDFFSGDHMVIKSDSGFSNSK